MVHRLLVACVFALALAPFLQAQDAKDDSRVSAPEVATLDDDLSQLKAAFAEGDGQVRLLMIMTPG